MDCIIFLLDRYVKANETDKLMGQAEDLQDEDTDIDQFKNIMGQLS